MHILLHYGLLAILSSVATALPNPAVNRIDVVVLESHLTKTHHKIITSPPTATATHASLEARNPAIGYMIDVVRPNPQSAVISTSVSAIIASDACEPIITLEARDPAVNRIDAVGAHVIPVMTAVKPPCAILSSSSALLEAADRLEARSPAVNRINAVGQDPIGQSVISLAGGSPVTLDADEVAELKAVATEQPIVTASIPSISANPAANTGNPPPASANVEPPGIRFDVPDTRTSLYLHYHPTQVIDKLALGQVLAEALVSLRNQITKDGGDRPIPMNEWSFVRDTWDCVIFCDANQHPGPGGRKQQLTYGTLHSTMTGLWGALFSKGNYFGADFDIYDGQWDKVGNGFVSPWQKGLDGEGGNVTSS